MIPRPSARFLPLLAVPMGFWVAASPLMMVAAIAAVGAICSVLFMPLRWLPSFALVAHVLLPVSYLPGNSVTVTISPGLLIMLAWAARTAAQPGALAPPGRLAAPALVLLAWLVLTTFRSLDFMASVAWVITFAVLVLAPALLAPNAPAETVRLLKRAWLGAGCILGVVAIMEFAFKTNPIAGVYITGSLPLDQVWSVYRVMTTLGHPLANGMFFAATFALATGTILIRGRDAMAWAATGLSGVAVVLTASRASLGGAALGATAAALVALFSSRVPPGRKAAMSAALAVLVWAGLSNPIVRERATSSEGIASAMVRQAAGKLAQQVAESYSFLGSGPATSLMARNQMFPTHMILESSYFQLLISVGVPALFLLAWLLAVTAFRAIGTLRLDALGALVALVICALGFNMVESYRPGLLLFGLAMLLAWAPRQSEALAERTAPQASVRQRL